MRLIISPAGVLLCSFKTNVYIMPAIDIIDKPAMYLYVSLLNLNSTGFGNKMERISSPLDVLKPVRMTNAFIFSLL
jgi:hypothetical protein